eukprot:scaffold9164_cov29-Tisochrysis_lutea.AAC.6
MLGVRGGRERDAVSRTSVRSGLSGWGRDGVWGGWQVGGAQSRRGNDARQWCTASIEASGYRRPSTHLPAGPCKASAHPASIQNVMEKRQLTKRFTSTPASRG